MQAVGSLIELGIDFVPVPGVKPAFDILYFIWQNVQQASNNREALRNLAISAADILTAVNHVLEEHDPTKLMRNMLYKLESILNDICSFAAEHASMNLFKLLIKNVDVDGRIEFFQSRLQNLWVAFNIVALGAIGSEVHLIHQGQQPGVKLDPSAAKTPPTYSQKIDHVLQKPNTTKASFKPIPQVKPSKLPRTQGHRDISKEPVLVGASSSIPYKIEVRQNAPFLSSRYNTNEPLLYWGLRPGTKVIGRLNTFEILQPRDSKSWKWTLAGKVISVSRRDPNHPRWQDSMDLAFVKRDSATTWFSWFEVYASSPPSVRTLRDPLASDLTLRKKTSHSSMRKSATTIEYKRATAENWVTILRGHAKTAREHASQLTYISTASYGRLPFCTLYRSGDTLVHERFIRADSLEPMISRRYRFDNVNQARMWYSLWKDCAMDNDGDEDLVPIELVTTYDCEIEWRNGGVFLASKAWRNIDLRDWGAPNFKRTETFEATTFNWTYKKANMITVNAVIDARPDWFDNLEIEFPAMKPASAWFSFLTGYPDGFTMQSSSAPPRIENVTVTNSRVCWIQKDGDAIETRTATSDRWIPVFGKSYKRIMSYPSHLSVVAGDSSVLPIMRIWTNGSTIHLDRRRSAEEKNSAVSRQYRFDSRVEAEAWYNIWRQHLQKLAVEIPK